MLPFQDPKLSPKERAHDLCARSLSNKPHCNAAVGLQA